MENDFDGNGLHIVHDGDTLMGIALKYNVNLNNLKRFNNLDSTVLYPGQVLKIKLPQRPSAIETTESDSPVVVSQLQSPKLSLSQPQPSQSSSASLESSPPPNRSATGSVTRYISNFFWKKDYNAIPSSPGKNVCRFDSTSPSNVIDFEKDAEEVTADIPNEAHLNETGVDPFRFVDNEFDAEVVEISSIPLPDSGFDQMIAPREEPSPPVVLGEPRILTSSQIHKLARYLPIVIQQHYWVLLYSVLRDGADFSTFFSRTRGHNITLVVVEAVNGDVFGGLATDRWQVSSKYYGSGNSFLFRIVDDEVIVYPWTMENDFIMWSSATRIAMGGGGDGFGFVLDDDFLTGQSNQSVAFGNPPLTRNAGSFRVSNVEIWGFESVVGRKIHK